MIRLVELLGAAYMAECISTPRLNIDVCLTSRGVLLRGTAGRKDRRYIDQLITGMELEEHGIDYLGAAMHRMEQILSKHVGAEILAERKAAA